MGNKLFRRIIGVFFLSLAFPFPLAFGQSLSREQIETVRRSFSNSPVQITEAKMQAERTIPEKTASQSVWHEKAWWAAITGSAADFTVSAARIDGVRIREGNPLFRKNGGEFAWGRNLAFTGGILSVEYLIWRKRPKQARWLMWITAGLRGGIAVYGLSIRK